jgi:predicted helicase
MNFESYLQQLQQNSELGNQRSHYPALQTLINNSSIEINSVIEEKGNKAGIPDFTVRKNQRLIGYIEAKKIGEDLNKIQETEQLKRYFDANIGQNLILTNFLEFRLFRDGKLYLYSSLGKLTNNQIIFNKDFTKTADLINNFANFQEKTINNYLDLAQQMAIYTKSVKYAIEQSLTLEESLQLENKTGELTTLKSVFSDLLLPDLDDNNFADMYAQTIAYGLFTARFYHAQNSDKSSLTLLEKQGNNRNTNSPRPLGEGLGVRVFTRQNASTYISNKIPFLKGLFQTIIKEDQDSQIDWAINNLIELFAQVDMDNILENFNQETGKQDIIVHFYETFLASYEVSLRKGRGVYYTPESAVFFIVKAVNDILDRDFDLELGLGARNVNILDPATGTGTFLYQVIKQICDNLSQYSPQKWEQNWDKYFRDRNLLNRLYGFELLMTPYTIAHLKLQLLLESLGYKFTEDERLNIFLTNTLDQGIKKSEYLLGEYIAKEGNEAAKIKNETPILVILGNPPYAGHSANKNSWIDVREYYQVDGLPLEEKNSKWLQDDYVKFIRFAQQKLEQIDLGIVAFITNHGYLDNPTFRGMRQSLMTSFSRIFILNLHGNAKKKEVSPDGSKDENIFDIQQGVSILIAIKDIKPENVKLLQLLQKLSYDYETPERGIFYYDIWGKREAKYKFLNSTNFYDIEWQKVDPISPFYLFTPQNNDLREEYHQFWKITDIMPTNSVGIVTARDKLTIQNSSEEVAKIVEDFVNLTEKKAREKYNLGKDSQDWKIFSAQKEIKYYGVNNNLIIPILYRPFDIKYTYYTGKSRGFICRPRADVMRNMLLGNNLGIAIGRAGQAIDQGEWNIIFCSNFITELNLYRRGGNNLFPLYIYPNTENGQSNLIQEKTANFSPEFITAIDEKLGYIPTPEKIFYYIYGVLYSPIYRERYAEFLKIDFPHIPFTSDNQLFNDIAQKGEVLVNLHLMKSLKLETLITTYHGEEETLITQIKYDEKEETLSINKNCYFTGISEEVWEFKIGGYQVLDKWLKDRKTDKKLLSQDDLIYYQKIIVVLTETLKIMREIDEIIPNFPI